MTFTFVDFSVGRCSLNGPSMCRASGGPGLGRGALPNTAACAACPFAGLPAPRDVHFECPRALSLSRTLSTPREGFYFTLRDRPLLSHRSQMLRVHRNWLVMVIDQVLQDNTLHSFMEVVDFQVSLEQCIFG